jgi:hypothetical protein
MEQLTLNVNIKTINPSVTLDEGSLCRYLSANFYWESNLIAYPICEVMSIEYQRGREKRHIDHMRTQAASPGQIKIPGEQQQGT